MTVWAASRIALNVAVLFVDINGLLIRKSWVRPDSAPKRSWRVSHTAFPAKVPPQDRVGSGTVQAQDFSPRLLPAHGNCCERKAAVWFRYFLNRYAPVPTARRNACL